ncbi:g5222 [Coccomyxa viridis]|uniref:G5222 protein n=1 Tax=Coccomyxa viridis TaxID=1274662 RepID=A0ABP1FS97_9CHLO
MSMCTSACLTMQGFHKILKKHNKLPPHAPCFPELQQFNLSHLHQQSWVQGNFSDFLVMLNNMYSKLRGDHLPVFQYNEGSEDQQDYELINRVYPDSSSMELYHGRLDKRPNAIAVRIRSYGDTELPLTCFVERIRAGKTGKERRASRSASRCARTRWCPTWRASTPWSRPGATSRPRCSPPCLFVEALGAIFSLAMRK